MRAVEVQRKAEGRPHLRTAFNWAVNAIGAIYARLRRSAKPAIPRSMRSPLVGSGTAYQPEEPYVAVVKVDFDAVDGDSNSNA